MVPSTERPSTDPNILRININSLYSHPLPVSLVGTIHDLLKHRLGNPMLVGSADWMTEATIVPVSIKSILRAGQKHSKAFLVQHHCKYSSEPTELISKSSKYHNHRGNSHMSSYLGTSNHQVDHPFVSKTDTKTPLLQDLQVAPPVPPLQPPMRWHGRSSGNVVSRWWISTGNAGKLQIYLLWVPFCQVYLQIVVYHPIFHVGAPISGQIWMMTSSI